MKKMHDEIFTLLCTLVVLLSNVIATELTGFKQKRQISSDDPPPAISIGYDNQTYNERDININGRIEISVQVEVVLNKLPVRQHVVVSCVSEVTNYQCVPTECQPSIVPPETETIKFPCKLQMSKGVYYKLSASILHEGQGSSPVYSEVYGTVPAPPRRVKMEVVQLNNSYFIDATWRSKSEGYQDRFYLKLTNFGFQKTYEFYEPHRPYATSYTKRLALGEEPYLGVYNLVVSAQSNGKSADQSGLAVQLVGPPAKNISVRSYDDGDSHALNIQLEIPKFKPSILHMTLCSIEPSPTCSKNYSATLENARFNEVDEKLSRYFRPGRYNTTFTITYEGSQGGNSTQVIVMTGLLPRGLTVTLDDDDDTSQILSFAFEVPNFVPTSALYSLCGTGDTPTCTRQFVNQNLGAGPSYRVTEAISPKLESRAYNFTIQLIYDGTPSDNVSISWNNTMPMTTTTTKPITTTTTSELSTTNTISNATTTAIATSSTPTTTTTTDAPLTKQPYYTTVELYSLAELAVVLAVVSCLLFITMNLLGVTYYYNYIRGKVLIWNLNFKS